MDPAHLPCARGGNGGKLPLAWILLVLLDGKVRDPLKADTDPPSN